MLTHTIHLSKHHKRVILSFICFITSYDIKWGYINLKAQLNLRNKVQNYCLSKTFNNLVDPIGAVCSLSFDKHLVLDIFFAVCVQFVLHLLIIYVNFGNILLSSIIFCSIMCGGDVTSLRGMPHHLSWIIVPGLLYPLKDQIFMTELTSCQQK